jgi:phytoene dehydrogenase-like protein
MAAHSVEAVVIGAGVIGLATARALAMKGKEVFIFERASTIGTGKNEQR